MEKKKLESGHECWTLDLRGMEEERIKKMTPAEILAEQIEDGLSQWTATLYDAEGNVIPEIECPKDKYVMHIISQDGHKQVLMDKGEPATFNYCPPKSVEVKREDQWKRKN